MDELTPQQRYLGTALDRLGTWYLLILAIVIWLMALAVTWLNILVFTELYFGATSDQSIRLLAFGTAASTLALALDVALFGGPSWKIVRWIRAGHPVDQALQSWEAAVKAPTRLVLPAGILTAVANVPTLVYGNAILDVVPAAAEAGSLGLLLTLPGIFAGSLLGYLIIEVGMAPILRRTLDDLPEPFIPSVRTLSLRAKLLLFVPIISVMAAFLAVGVAGGRADPFERIVAAFLAAILISGSIGLLLTWMISRSLGVPIDRLARGAERVSRGDLTVRVLPLSGDEIGALATTFNEMVGGLRERQSLHAAMGAYIDPAIAERVISEGSAIAGESADVTVMFVDIVGFTNFAEDAVPEEVVADLNDFFNIVIPAIERQGGHANKLLGDGLMAVFGVPKALEDHADRALAAAREIQNGLSERYGDQLKAGIGLNSGTVVVGSMGGGAKLDYTIIGDAVNVAARVEAYTRQTGDGILLTDTTKALLATADGLEPRGAQALKGRAASVGLWAAI